MTFKEGIEKITCLNESVTKNWDMHTYYHRAWHDLDVNFYNPEVAKLAEKYGVTKRNAKPDNFDKFEDFREACNVLAEEYVDKWRDLRGEIQEIAVSSRALSLFAQLRKKEFEKKWQFADVNETRVAIQNEDGFIVYFFVDGAKFYTTAVGSSARDFVVGEVCLQANTLEDLKKEIESRLASGYKLDKDFDYKKNIFVEVENNLNTPLGKYISDLQSGAVTRYFTIQNARMQRFWNITNKGKQYIIEWGDIGKKSNSRVYGCINVDKCNIEIEKQINTTLRNGYVEGEAVAVSEPTEDDFEVANGVLTAYKGTSTEIKFPDRVKVVGANVFKGNESIARIEMPYGFKGIEASAFAGCKKLEKIVFANTTESIGDEAFKGCESLQEALLPTSTKVGVAVFENCINLKRVTPSRKAPSITDRMFKGCVKLNGIQIPRNIVSIGESAFEGCESVDSFSLHDSFTSIGARAFTGCSKLSNALIVKSVTSIGASAFASCGSAITITVAGGQEQANGFESGWNEEGQGCAITVKFPV